MANIKISELGAAGALGGTELIETVQGGVNKQTTTQDIANLGGTAPIVPDTRIPFGNGVDAYTSSSDFVYDVSGGIFEVVFNNLNLTGIRIEDVAQTITLNANSGSIIGRGNIYNLYDAGGSNTYFFIDVIADDSKWGDITGATNNTFLDLNNASQLLTYQKGSNKYLSLDIVNSIFEFGDLDNINRTGKIIIDDATDVTTIQQRGLTYIGDWEDRNNSTRLIIDDPNKILTYQKASDAYLSIDVTTDVYKIGNPNTTWAEWNGPNKTIEEYYGIYPMLLLDWFNYIFKIGDVDAGSLGNVFVVDDFGSLSYYDNIRAQAVAVTGLLNAATAGSVDFYLLVSLLPS